MCGGVVWLMIYTAHCQIRRIIVELHDQTHTVRPANRFIPRYLRMHLFSRYQYVHIALAE